MGIGAVDEEVKSGVSVLNRIALNQHHRTFRIGSSPRNRYWIYLRQLGAKVMMASNAFEAALFLFSY
jgi:hypothetical protein